MPASLILFLTAQQDKLPPGILGREAQGWFLQQAARTDAQLAEELHRENGMKPYTVSGLMEDSSHPHGYYLRITALDEATEDLLLRWGNFPAEYLPDSLGLWWAKFTLESATLDARVHSWAGYTSYSELAQMTTLEDTPQPVYVEFVSPTSFASAGEEIVLPFPHLVYRSWWDRWKTYYLPAAEEREEIERIDRSWRDFLPYGILPCEVRNLNSSWQEFANGKRGRSVGFHGQVGYKLRRREQCGEWADFWPYAAHLFTVLAEYSFYCGTGHHTTLGLGQTRRMP